MMENNGELLRNLFLSEQDIRNLVRKLAKKTYKKHENDAQNVWIWVVENKYKVFFYQESGGKVEGNFYNSHMPFTIGIQIEWKK